MTDMIESPDTLDWESMFTATAQAAVTDLPEEYYADPDDDPLAHLSPSMTYVKFDGGDGTFSDGEEELGRELTCVILDIARTRELWTPRETYEKLYDELSSFPDGRPLCQNRDVDNEKPRFHQDLTPEQHDRLRTLGAGDCESCELTSKGCRSGRKLLLFNPRWPEPVVLQVHGTSIGGLYQMLRRDFKDKGRSIGVFTRPVKLFAKKQESKDDKGKKIAYYQLQGEAYGLLNSTQINTFLAMRDMYRIRGGRTGTPALTSGSSPPQSTPVPSSGDQGRLV